PDTTGTQAPGEGDSGLERSATAGQESSWGRVRGAVEPSHETSRQKKPEGIVVAGAAFWDMNEMSVPVRPRWIYPFSLRRGLPWLHERTSRNPLRLCTIRSLIADRQSYCPI